ncbi:unnamed protein product [Cyprideis torosa]|uniref:Uncharacterized protein n=1 Tax=Cyprideis torosa TaxID=163714 RepID=A0A7R8WEG1_9CRUS|nr:unnamed protein product [Cyprideis torosa]CAG0894303.1 unnamed protein product [Cyprideis torosa]
MELDSSGSDFTHNDSTSESSDLLDSEEESDDELETTTLEDFYHYEKSSGHERETFELENLYSDGESSSIKLDELYDDTISAAYKGNQLCSKESDSSCSGKITTNSFSNIDKLTFEPDPFQNSPPYLHLPEYDSTPSKDYEESPVKVEIKTLCDILLSNRMNNTASWVLDMVYCKPFFHGDRTYPFNPISLREFIGTQKCSSQKPLSDVRLLEPIVDESDEALKEHRNVSWNKQNSPNPEELQKPPKDPEKDVLLEPLKKESGDSLQNMKSMASTKDTNNKNEESLEKRSSVLEDLVSENDEDATTCSEDQDTKVEEDILKRDCLFDNTNKKSYEYYPDSQISGSLNEPYSYHVQANVQNSRPHHHSLEMNSKPNYHSFEKNEFGKNKAEEYGNWRESLQNWELRTFKTNKSVFKELFPPKAFKVQDLTVKDRYAVLQEVRDENTTGIWEENNAGEKSKELGNLKTNSGPHPLRLLKEPRSVIQTKMLLEKWKAHRDACSMSQSFIRSPETATGVTNHDSYTDLTDIFEESKKTKPISSSEKRMDEHSDFSEDSKENSKFDGRNTKEEVLFRLPQIWGVRKEEPSPQELEKEKVKVMLEELHQRPDKIFRSHSFVRIANDILLRHAPLTTLLSTPSSRELSSLRQLRLFSPQQDAENLPLPKQAKQHISQPSERNSASSVPNNSLTPSHSFSDKPMELEDIHDGPSYQTEFTTDTNTTWNGWSEQESYNDTKETTNTRVPFNLVPSARTNEFEANWKILEDADTLRPRKYVSRINRYNAYALEAADNNNLPKWMENLYKRKYETVHVPEVEEDKLQKLLKQADESIIGYRIAFQQRQGLSKELKQTPWFLRVTKKYLHKETAQELENSQGDLSNRQNGGSKKQTDITPRNMEKFSDVSIRDETSEANNDLAYNNFDESNSWVGKSQMVPSTSWVGESPMAHFRGVYGAPTNPPGQWGHDSAGLVKRVGQWPPTGRRPEAGSMRPAWCYDLLRLIGSS